MLLQPEVKINEQSRQSRIPLPHRLQLQPVGLCSICGITVEEAAKKASPFGAGFGKLREVCGAVTGMVMVIGDLYGYDDPKDAAGKKQLYVLVQKLCGSFEASEGSLICRELLGLEKGEDLEEPAVRTEAYYQSRPCVKACRRAAEILEEYVKEQKRK